MERRGSGLSDMWRETVNNNGRVEFGPVDDNSAFVVSIWSRPEAIDSITNTVVADTTHLPMHNIAPNPHPRKHDRSQIEAIARSIEAFGFNAPILLDRDGQIVAGHGRFEAAKMLGITEAPLLRLEHLSAAQTQAYMLADNKLGDRSSWDEISLASHLRDLSEMALEFDIQATGFELPEIDVRVQSLVDHAGHCAADDFKGDGVTPRAKPGSLWQLGEHRIYCADALLSDNYRALLGRTRAHAVFTDPPYNVKIDGHVSGNGKVSRCHSAPEQRRSREPL